MTKGSCFHNTNNIINEMQRVWNALQRVIVLQTIYGWSFMTSVTFNQYQCLHAKGKHDVPTLTTWYSQISFCGVEDENVTSAGFLMVLYQTVFYDGLVT